jgi:hypothetical protein
MAVDSEEIDSLCVKAAMNHTMSTGGINFSYQKESITKLDGHLIGNIFSICYRNCSILCDDANRPTSISHGN